jgi:hypothetical protein
MTEKNINIQNNHMQDILKKVLDFNMRLKYNESILNFILINWRKL